MAPRSRTRSLLLAAVLAVAAGLGSGRYLGLRAARAETTSCTAITTLPYTIATQGIYCLTGDLSTSITAGNAITIDTNNVVIDLNGHKLGGLSAGTGTNAVGISAFQRQNITVKNGTIRGFYLGINITDNTPYTTSQGHVIEDVRADQNTGTGIALYGRGVLVRHCQVVATGGSTSHGPNTGAVGIQVVGPGARVVDSDVAAVIKQGTGTAWAILLGPNSPDAMIVGNRLTQADVGIQITSTGKYRDNLTSSVATPFTGGTDAGRNN